VGFGIRGRDEVRRGLVVLEGWQPSEAERYRAPTGRYRSGPCRGEEAKARRRPRRRESYEVTEVDEVDEVDEQDAKETTTTDIAGVEATDLARDPRAGDRAGNERRKERHAAFRKKGCCVSGKPRCRGGVFGSCRVRGGGRQDDGVKRSRGSERAPRALRAEGTRVREDASRGRTKRETEKDVDVIRG